MRFQLDGPTPLITEKENESISNGDDHSTPQRDPANVKTQKILLLLLLLLTVNRKTFNTP